MLKDNIYSFHQRKRRIKAIISRKKLRINGQAKKNLFDHWCFIASDVPVCLVIFKDNPIVILLLHLSLSRIDHPKLIHS